MSNQESKRSYVSVQSYVPLTASSLTVTEISRRNHINILTLSDGSTLCMPHALFENAPWRTGSPITRASFESWLDENEYTFAMQRAGHTLSARNRTEHELAETLRQAGYRETPVTRVLTRLIQVVYIDDTAFVQSWIRHRNSSGYGQNRIRQELRMKGISEELIANALGSQDDDDIFSSAYRAAEKAARGKDLTNYK